MNEEGVGEQVPRKRIRIKAKTYETAAQIEPDEDVFTIQEEKDHEAWRQFHQQQKLKRHREHSHFAKQVVGQEILAARISIPVFEEDVFCSSMDATALRGNSVEVPESRFMSMRWVLTWKPSDEHPQGRKAKARIVVLVRGISIQRLPG